MFCFGIGIQKSESYDADRDKETPGSKRKEERTELMSRLKNPSRIDALKEKMLDEERYVSIEQARIITNVYRENEELSVVKKRALWLKKCLEQLEISVEPEELIVGNRSKGVRAGIVFPESGLRWVNEEYETIPVRDQDRFSVRPEDIEKFRNEIYPFWQHRSMEDWISQEYGPEISEMARVVKINQKDHAQGHICPNTEEWLRLGPAGLIEKAKENAALHPENPEFYEAVQTVLEGSQIFMNRYADLLDQTAENNPEYSQDLTELAEICRSLAIRPARTFHEALQSVWFLFVILHMESNASSFSPGRLDQILLPYFENDKKEGRLDDQKALELLEALFLKFNQIVYLRNAHSAKYFAGFPIGFNIAIGGVDENGNDAQNELSFLFLDAQYDLGLPQPNLSVRLHKDTSHELMQRAIEVVARGSGMPQFFNDEAIVEPMQELGVSEEDARNYAITGCVELTTHGNNLGWSDAAMFNMNKALELALNHGVCMLDGKQMSPDFGGLEEFETFEDLETAYQKTLDYFIEEMMEAEIVVEKAHQKFLPTAFLSSVIDDCLAKGLDVTAGGAKYNLTGIQMIQAANLADSLAAIKKLVYEEQIIGKEELMDALRNDFEGYEVLQARLLKRVPKYGNDVAWVDEMASKWADYFRNRMDDFTNYRGGPVHTGMYTVSAHVPMGENVGASADGRNARTPLADGGISPVYGRDLAGPTAVLKSVSRISCRNTTNGGLLNMKFLPDFFRTEEGRNKFETLLRAFVDLKIPHVQFNVVNREDLLDAKVHPERHQSLTIRVAGYTAYFTELAGKLQDEIIARTTYEDI